MAIQTRTIKGQPLVVGNSLVQDQILLVTTDGKTVRSATGQYVVLENIWDDLQSTSGTWKRRKNHFYWLVERTETTDDNGSDSVIKQMVDCTKPTPELFDFDFTENPEDSEWTKYWKEKFRETENSPYNSVNATYRKEVILPGTKYIKFGNVLTQGQDEAVELEDGGTGAEEIKVEERIIDMDDTMNLLAAREDHIQTDLDDLSGLLGSMI
jgi:hypothetical protein